MGTRGPDDKVHRRKNGRRADGEQPCRALPAEKNREKSRPQGFGTHDDSSLARFEVGLGPGLYEQGERPARDGEVDHPRPVNNTCGELYASGQGEQDEDESHGQ